MSNIHKPKACETGKTGKEKSQDSKTQDYVLKGQVNPCTSAILTILAEIRGGKDQE